MEDILKKLLENYSELQADADKSANDIYESSGAMMAKFNGGVNPHKIEPVDEFVTNSKEPRNQIADLINPYLPEAMQLSKMSLADSKRYERDAPMQMVLGMGMGGIATKVGPSLVGKLKDLAVDAEGKIAGLSESSVLRELMSSPSMQKLREPIRAERNIRLGKQAELDKLARKPSLDKFYEEPTFKVKDVSESDRLKSISKVDDQVELEMLNNKIKAQEEALVAAKKKLQTDGPSLESLENTIPSLKEPTSIAPDYNVPAGYNQRNLPVGYGQTNLPIGYQNNIPAESQLMNEIVDLPVGYGNLKKFMLNK